MKTVLFFSLIISSIQLYSQSILISDTVSVYQEDETNVSLNSVRIPVNFDQTKLLTKIPEHVDGKTIERIDVVYSINKENPTYDQERLNKQRIVKFQQAFPAAKNELIQWNLIGQEGYTNKSEAQDLFHGFVIYYRPSPTPESMEKEINYIDELLGFGNNSIEEQEIKPDKEMSSSNVVSATETKVILGDDASLDFSERCYQRYTITKFCTQKEIWKLNDSIHALPGFTSSEYTYTAGLEENDPEDPHNYIYNYVLLQEECMDEAVTKVMEFIFGFDYANYNTDYPIVADVFERNESWKNALVVMDVTGSMSPYIGETMSWLRETQKSGQIAAFTFFNDGDNKADGTKVMGRVGGVYSIKNNNFNEVYEVMKETMRKGGGGDAPENNIEATIKGLKEFNEVDEIVMVADNWATPRDLKLVEELNRPVHIIVCGSRGGVNIAYLQLAFKTGGSVHTIEEDLELMDVKPNETFKLGNYYYTLIGGKIVKAEDK